MVKKYKMNKTEAVTIIRSLLSSTNSSFNISTLNKEFREVTGMDLPLFGYNSLSDFLQSIPETVKLTGVYPAQKVSLVNNDTSGHIVSLVKKQKKCSKSKGSRKHHSGYFWRNDRSGDSLSDKASDGKENEMPPLVTANILSQIVKDYNKNKNDNVHKINKNFGSRESGQVNCCGKSPEKTEFRFSNKKFITEKSSQSEDSKNESTGSSYQSELFSNVVNDVSKPLLKTSDVLQCYVQKGEDIAGIDLKLHTKVGHYIEVSPCEISHPGLFYLHLRKFKNALGKFMDKLQKFYNEQNIPNLTSTPNQGEICVVFYCKSGDLPRWHRVQIQEILNDFLVVVQFIDYGSTSKILVKNLKPLHRKFSSFPRQAILGSLANIKPFGGHSKWSKSAIRRFHELAFCRDLVAGVVSCDYGLNVALSSTVGEEVHVNDTLVDEGLADFDLNVTKVREAEVEKKKSSTGSILERDVASPLFYPSKNCSNTRLKKMFSRQE